jgi:hypothetical protein
MKAAAVRLAGGVRHALGDARDSAVELGAPPTWPASELHRVRAEARRLARARARRQARGVIALAAAAATVAAVLGVSIVQAAAAAALGVAAWWAHQAWDETPVVARWRCWTHARSVLERELRLLGPDWRILWDRRVHGLPAPAILAVGPSGVWTLWAPEPGIDAHADPQATATSVHEAAGVPAVAYVLQRPAEQLRIFVHEIACAPRVASRDDIARAAERLNTTLLQEPVGVGL